MHPFATPWKTVTENRNLFRGNTTQSMLEYGFLLTRILLV